jgi:hypothetical protein
VTCFWHSDRNEHITRLGGRGASKSERNKRKRMARPKETPFAKRSATTIQSFVPENFSRR